MRIIFIAGPTAIGKTQFALDLAKEITGEIISCDSMQVYREIRVASNKPSAEVLKEIPHHLINVVSIEEEFDAARFNRLALKAIEDIHRRERTPLVVGGTGLYMQILLDGIFESKPKNESLREELKEKAKEKGISFLYDILKIEDPAAAQKIHPNDLRRIIRALEVTRTEKRPFSELQKNRQGLWGKYDIQIFGLNRPRQELYERIEARVEQMFENGLVEEIKSLENRNWSKTAQNIIGVREVLGYLKKEYDLKRAKELMKLNTRHLAKKQLTWFRKDQRIEWIYDL